MNSATPSSSGTVFVHVIACVVAALLVLEPAAQASTVSKVFARNPSPELSHYFGMSIAANDKWIAIAEPSHQMTQPSQGAVHVFKATTGAYVRRLIRPQAQQFTFFGRALAISGNQLLVGTQSNEATLVDLSTGKTVRQLVNPAISDLEYGASVALQGNTALVGNPHGDGVVAQSGVVHVFNAATGAWQMDLKALDGKDSANFGNAVAMQGSIALVAAQYMDDTGVVYVFDLQTGTQLRKLVPADGTPGDVFGYSIALSGNRAIIGAKYQNNDRGAVYVFDLTSGASTKLTQSNPSDNDEFGYSVAANSTTLLVGCYGRKIFGPFSGAAYLYDLNTLTLIEQITPPDGASMDTFGEASALIPGAVIVSASGDDDAFDAGGSAYIFRQKAGPLPFTQVTAEKDFAPQVPNTSLLKLDSSAINAQGEVIFSSSLTGYGAPTSKNVGIWSTLAPGMPLDLILQKGDSVGGGIISGVAKPLLNQATLGLFEVTLAGSGISSTNNRALLADDGSTLTTLLRLGDPLATFGGAKTSSFGQIVQSVSFAREAAIVGLKTGVAGVTPATDSGLLLLDQAGAVIGSVREGTVAPVSGNVGQINRVAMPSFNACFSAGITGAPGITQGLFIYNGATISLVARQADTATGATGAKFSAFTGETCSNTSQPLFRASLAGSGLNSSNNTGLWCQPTFGGALVLVARAGDPVPGLSTGTKWVRFPQFWLRSLAGLTQIVFVADIAGPGVNSTNNQGLWLQQEDGSFRLLLRKGDTLSDSSGARIAAIQRVAFNPLGGCYAVLASLTASSPVSNQALLTGNVLGPTLQFSAFRCAELRVRKGDVFREPDGTPRTLTSLAFTTNGNDPTGAGGKGLALQINDSGELLLKATFNDGSVRLLKGRP